MRLILRITPMNLMVSLLEYNVYKKEGEIIMKKRRILKIMEDLETSVISLTRKEFHRIVPGPGMVKYYKKEWGAKSRHWLSSIGKV